jgi:Tfp pilus assembly protein PilF
MDLADERVMLRLGNLLLRLESYEEAESQLRDAVSHPMSAKEGLAAGHYDLACVAARTGRSAQCRESLEMALALAPLYRREITQDQDFESVRRADWFLAIVQEPGQSLDSPPASSVAGPEI